MKNLPKAKNQWGKKQKQKHDKRKLASKCKYLLKPSVKSKPPASEQIAGSVTTASEVTAQEQARGLG